MFKYVKYILVVMVLGMGLIAFNQIVKADNEVVDVGENISFRQIIMMFFLILFPKNYMKIGLQNRFLMHF